MPFLSPIQLNQLVTASQNHSSDCKLLSPLPSSQKQEGQICKLNALSMVLNWLHETYHMPKPYPVRKSYSNESVCSLRKIAKHKYHSQVGEVYDAGILTAIAEDNGYDDHEILTMADENEYIQTLIKLINNGQAPIVFFDVHVKTGDPIKAESKWEHAAMVVGYFKDNFSRICFVAAQGGYYSYFLATDLAASAAQLSLSRKAETFLKYGTKWVEYEATATYNPLLFFSSPDDKRVSISPDPLMQGLRNKILVIKKPSLLKLHSHESERLLIKSNR